MLQGPHWAGLVVESWWIGGDLNLLSKLLIYRVYLDFFWLEYQLEY